MGVANFLKDTRGELRHVSWPTRNQAVAFTTLVISISIIVALLLGLCDAGFSKLFQAIFLG